MEQIYNKIRLYSALGYRSPEEFEQSQKPEVKWSPAALSFLRDDEIYRWIPKTIFSLRPSAGVPLVGPEPHNGRYFEIAPFPSSAMSLGLGISRQVALQQSLPPLPQPAPLCNDRNGPSSKSQRSVLV